MAKTRISISLDPAHAARIREHAERAGMDLSAYLVNAATQQMAQADEIEAQFTQVDAMIAQAEVEAATLDPGSEIVAEDLTEEERQDVEAALDLVYGTDRPAVHPGDAA
jgi:hypothetical protein